MLGMAAVAAVVPSIPERTLTFWDFRMTIPKDGDCYTTGDKLTALEDEYFALAGPAFAAGEKIPDHVWKKFYDAPVNYCYVGQSKNGGHAYFVEAV